VKKNHIAAYQNRLCGGTKKTGRGTKDLGEKQKISKDENPVDGSDRGLKKRRNRPSLTVSTVGGGKKERRVPQGRGGSDHCRNQGTKGASLQTPKTGIEGRTPF